MRYLAPFGVGSPSQNIVGKSASPGYAITVENVSPSLVWCADDGGALDGSLDAFGNPQYGCLLQPAGSEGSIRYFRKHQSGLWIRSNPQQGSPPALDKVTSNAGNSTTPSAGPLTPTNYNEFLLAWLQSPGGSTFTPQNGFTQFDNGIQQYGLQMPVPFAATFAGTLLVSTGWQAAMAAFRMKPGFLQPSIVQPDNGPSGSITNGINTTFAKPNIAGNTIIVWVFGTGSANCTVSDSAGNVYTILNSQVSGITSFVAAAFNCKGTAGGANDTVTLNTGGPSLTGGSFTIAEYGGILSPNPAVEVVYDPDCGV